MQNKLSIQTTLKEAHNLTKLNFKKFLPFLLIYLVMDLLILAKIDLSIADTFIVNFILAYLFLDYKTNILHSPEAGLKKFHSLVVPIILLSLIQSIFIIGLFLLLIIPSIIFAVYWSFAIIVLADKNIQGINALKESKKIIKGNWWKIFFLLLIGISAALIVILMSNPLFILFDLTIYIVIPIIISSIASCIILLYMINILISAYETLSKNQLNGDISKTQPSSNI